MIQLFEAPNFASSIANQSHIFKPPPTLQQAPDTQRFSHFKRPPEMPKLTPAPNFVSKSSFSEECDQFHAISPPILDDSAVPMKRAKTSATETADISLSPAKKLKMLRKPRTKITNEHFLRISNMGYSLSNDQTCFKCFSSWCNFKAKSKQRFLGHLQAHHQHDSSLKPFGCCEICRSSFSASKLEDEFIHMITSHVDELASDSSSSPASILLDSTDSETDTFYTLEVASKETIKSNEDCSNPPLRLQIKEEDAIEISSSFESDSSEIAIDANYTFPEESEANISSMELESSDERPKLKIVSVESLHKAAQAETKHFERRSSDDKTREIKEALSEQKQFKRSISLHSHRHMEPIVIQKDPTKKRMSEERTKEIDKLISEEKLFLKRIPSNLSSASSSPSSTSSLPRAYSRTPSRVYAKPSSSQAALHSPITTSMAVSSPPKSYRFVAGTELMEWEENTKLIRQNEKHEIAFKNMRRKRPLIALFKCMGKLCSYTTSCPSQMFSHLTCHDMSRASAEKKVKNDYHTKLRTFQFVDGEREKIEADMNAKMLELRDFYFYCSYCVFKGKTANELVHHVNDVHRKDIYQCGYCFYRSCSRETCYQHLIHTHHRTKSLIVIYECPEMTAFEAARKKSQARLIRKRKENVTELQCKFCNIGFYPLEPFLDHMEQLHYEKDENSTFYVQMSILNKIFESECYGMFQCLYCLFGCKDSAKMSKHLVNHPSEFAFCCQRRPPKNITQNELPPNFYNTLDSTEIVSLEKNVPTICFEESYDTLLNENYQTLIDEDLSKVM